MKLSRRVQFFDVPSFSQWVRLEADPDVISFCERPTRVGTGAASLLIAFWVQRREAQEFLHLSRDDAPPNLAAEHEGTALRVVTPPELVAAEVWIDNWLRMLPVVTCTRALLTEALKRSILKLARAPIALSRIEREHPHGDPMLVRGAVFDLLRTGALSAPSLHRERLGLHSSIEPV